MRYLKEYKLFESQSYYQQMPFLSVDDALFDEYLDITDKALSISDEEINWIKSMVNRIVGQSKIPLIIKSKKRKELGGEGDDYVQVSVSFNNDHIVLSIYKADDDWWWVSTLGWKGDFKCDQRDGLQKMIEDVWFRNYKDWDFNLWYKLDYAAMPYIYNESLGERLELVNRHIGSISNDVGKEISYLEKVQWVGLGSLDFVQKEYNDYVYIQSNRSHRDEDKYQGYNDDEGNSVVSNEKSYFFIYKNSDNYYLLEDRTSIDNSESQGYSEFYHCNSFEGVRSAIKFVLRLKS